MKYLVLKSVKGTDLFRGRILKAGYTGSLYCEVPSLLFESPAVAKITPAEIRTMVLLKVLKPIK